MDRGRYTRYHTSRLPHRKRCIPVDGSFEDRGKYRRCWNCGFIVDMDRYSGNSDRLGTTQEWFAHGTSLALDIFGSLGVLVELKPDGTALTEDESYEMRKPEVTAGCSFCGCTNLL